MLVGHIFIEGVFYITDTVYESRTFLNFCDSNKWNTLFRMFSLHPVPFSSHRHHKFFFPFWDCSLYWSLSINTLYILRIIGENGARKSTLLKILTGTARPTSGRMVKRGRMAALLELGSGFHPEFSGRQNIYLNAALLGLKKKRFGTGRRPLSPFPNWRVPSTGLSRPNHRECTVNLFYFVSCSGHWILGHSEIVKDGPYILRELSHFLSDTANTFGFDDTDCEST